MPRRLKENRRQHLTQKHQRYRGFSSIETNIRPAPIHEGEEFDVKIDALGNRGDGLTKIHDFKVYVRGASLGDRVRIRIDSVMGTFATASVIKNASVESDGGEGDHPDSQEVEES